MTGYWKWFTDKRLEKENKHIIEYRLNQEGQSGCKTVFDIAPVYLSAKSDEELRAHLL